MYPSVPGFDVPLGKGGCTQKCSVIRSCQVPCRLKRNSCNYLLCHSTGFSNDGTSVCALSKQTNMAPQRQRVVCCPSFPSLPRELRNIRSCSEFQRNLTRKTRQIPKASADKWWNVASKARGRWGEKKKCRCFSAATTCTLGARFFSRITPKNYSGWGIVVHLRAV